MQPSIANTTNIDTLLGATEPAEIKQPADAAQDKIHFIFNNISTSNLSQKVGPLSMILMILQTLESKRLPLIDLSIAKNVVNIIPFSISKTDWLKINKWRSGDEDFWKASFIRGESIFTAERLHECVFLSILAWNIFEALCLYCLLTIFNIFIFQNYIIFLCFDQFWGCHVIKMLDHKSEKLQNVAYHYIEEPWFPWRLWHFSSINLRLVYDG